MAVAVEVEAEVEVAVVAVAMAMAVAVVGVVVVVAVAVTVAVAAAVSTPPRPAPSRPAPPAPPHPTRPAPPHNAQPHNVPPPHHPHLVPSFAGAAAPSRTEHLIQAEERCFCADDEALTYGRANSSRRMRAGKPLSRHRSRCYTAQLHCTAPPLHSTTAHLHYCTAPGRPSGATSIHSPPSTLHILAVPHLPLLTRYSSNT